MSPGLEIRTWKVRTYQGEIPKRASIDGLGLSPGPPTLRGFRMKEEVPAEEMEKACVKREGKLTGCGVGPGSQVKNMLARESDNCVSAADGSSEMATLVAMTRIGQWWDEIDWWDESPIGEH